MSRKQWGHGYYTGLKDGIEANLSFAEYLKILYSEENNKRGKIARCILQDVCFPINADKWMTISFYLFGREEFFKTSPKPPKSLITGGEDRLEVCEMWHDWESRFKKTRRNK